MGYTPHSIKQVNEITSKLQAYSFILMRNKLSFASIFILFCFAILAPVLLFAGSGKHKEAAPVPFTVSGDIAGMPEHMVKLELLRANDTVVAVDSQRSNAAGHFELAGSLREPGLYRVHFQMDRFILLSVDKGNIKIAATWPVEGYTVQGSEPSERIKIFIDSVRNFMGKMQNGSKQLESIKASGNKELFTATQKDLEQMNQAFLSFTKQYSDTTPYEANAILAARVINPEGQYSYFESFAGNLEKRFPGATMTREYKQYLVKLKASMPLPTDIGDKAPDLSLDDTAGKAIALSSLQGKYVLLDFWASWCGPCRAENPNVLAAYKKYKGRNFTILAVSLDSKRDQWLKAVQHDGLLWPQVSDLEGWQSGAAAKYGVHAIPTNFLIDPSGVIIAKSLRGPELESKLEEVLPK